MNNDTASMQGVLLNLTRIKLSSMLHKIHLHTDCSSVYGLIKRQPRAYAEAGVCIVVHGLNHVTHKAVVFAVHVLNCDDAVLPQEVVHHFLLNTVAPHFQSRRQWCCAISIVKLLISCQVGCAEFQDPGYSPLSTVLHNGDTFIGTRAGDLMLFMALEGRTMRGMQCRPLWS